MQHLKPLETGAIFWPNINEAPEKTIATHKDMGLRVGQLLFEGDYPLNDETAAAWKKALADADFTIITLFAAYNGEDYADIPTVTRTVGFVPKQYRAERLQRTRELSDFAAKLGVPGIGCHIGCVPEDPGHEDYQAVLEITREIADYAGTHGQTFALETGQEPADVLLKFLEDTGRSNVKINFDPANLILYGTGDPMEALDQIGHKVISVHAKDGVWPKGGPGSLGEERVLGEGDVGMSRFIKKLREIGFGGPLCIECGIPPLTDLTNMKKGIEALKVAKGEQ
jgi:sugar phosphate isomerase/epimerase